MSLDEKVFNIFKEEISFVEYAKVKKACLIVSFVKRNKFGDEGVIGNVDKESSGAPEEGLKTLAIFLSNKLKEIEIESVNINYKLHRLKVQSRGEKVNISFSLNHPKNSVAITYLNFSDYENLYLKVKDFLNTFLSGSFRIKRAKPVSEYSLRITYSNSVEVTKVLLKGLLTKNKDPIVEDLQKLPTKKYNVYISQKGEVEEDLESHKQNFVKYTLMF